MNVPDYIIKSSVVKKIMSKAKSNNLILLQFLFMLRPEGRTQKDLVNEIL